MVWTFFGKSRFLGVAFFGLEKFSHAWCGRFLAKAVFSELPIWDDEKFPILEAQSKFGTPRGHRGDLRVCWFIESFSAKLIF